MYFYDEFEIEMNGSVYHAVVEGTVERDGYDSDVYTSYVDTYSFVDENDQIINEEHPDYDELVEDVVNRDYHPKAWR